MLRTSLILFVFLGIWNVAAGQLDQLRFKHFRIEDGLSNNTVLCIQQDPYGFMWFGTLDGLNRFDGYDFRIFKHNPKDSLSLSSNHINTIFLDGDRNLFSNRRRSTSAQSVRKEYCAGRQRPIVDWRFQGLI